VVAAALNCGAPTRNSTEFGRAGSNSGAAPWNFGAPARNSTTEFQILDGWRGSPKEVSEENSKKDGSSGILAGAAFLLHCELKRLRPVASAGKAAEASNSRSKGFAQVRMSMKTVEFSTKPAAAESRSSGDRGPSQGRSKARNKTPAAPTRFRGRGEKVAKFEDFRRNFRRSAAELLRETARPFKLHTCHVAAALHFGAPTRHSTEFGRAGSNSGAAPWNFGEFRVDATEFGIGNFSRNCQLASE